MEVGIYAEHSTIIDGYLSITADTKTNVFRGKLHYIYFGYITYVSYITV
jgi:hypothetical protein